VKALSSGDQDISHEATCAAGNSSGHPDKPNALPEGPLLAQSGNWQMRLLESLAVLLLTGTVSTAL
jgi:hypothetical protein